MHRQRHRYTCMLAWLQVHVCGKQARAGTLASRILFLNWNQHTVSRSDSKTYTQHSFYEGGAKTHLRWLKSMAQDDTMGYVHMS